jgi:4-amino-4-deoxy-L-arabinose transferase-like glycosyltransferase
MSKQRLAAVPPIVYVLLLTLACLAPFLNRAFAIDDTLFLRAAEHIQKHPGDFYGFDFNWLGTPKPMPQVFDNPPLTSYYIALIASFGGWSEPVLHLAFLLPALAAAWGIFSLARNYCGQPGLAAMVAVFTPVFIICANSVMCDVASLAFWVWSLVLFHRGLRQNSRAAFLASGLLAAGAALTKFSGLTLVPLLVVAGVMNGRLSSTPERVNPQSQPTAGVGWWLLAPLLPLLFAAGYEWLTHRLYGRGQLLEAAAFSTLARTKGPDSLPARWMLGLAFAGGCYLPLLFYASKLWSRRALIAGLGLLALGLFFHPHLAKFAPLLQRDGKFPWGILLQSTLFTLAGLHLLFLAGIELWQRREASSLFLLLWIVGVLVFATTVNWTVNGRSLLPMAPALGILLARRLEQRTAPAVRPSGRPRTARPATSLNLRPWWPALPAACLSLFLARVDYRMADTERQAAGDLTAKYRAPGSVIWFEGHWGFQYYMEKLGAKPLDLGHAFVNAQDVIIIPNHADAVSPPDLNLLTLIDQLEYAPNPHFAVMNPFAGAGFYSARNAPFPFVAGNVESEIYFVFKSKVKE